MANDYTITEDTVQAAVALATKAVQRDKWMTPLVDFAGKSSEAAIDYDTFADDLRDAWEETLHFELYYDSVLDKLADQEAAYYEITADVDFDTWCEEFWSPLRDKFWFTWAEAHKLREFWEENVKKETSDAS